MTMFSPNLQLRALDVMDGTRTVYSALFHEGVNIISGQNASGKSTVVDFIFYALGGENVPWKNEALLCTDVLVQLSINDRPLTLKRIVNDRPRNPISIYWGSLDKAIVAKYSEWETYPYQRSQSKESFSQVLFRALGLPELKGEGATNITMHQLLRLMYVDQRTPHDDIFRSEPFDTILTRETVGNFLCGIYSDKLYDAQVELKSVEGNLERSVSDLRNLFSLLGRTGQGGVNTSDFLRADAASVAEEVQRYQLRLSQIRGSTDQTSDEKFKSVETVNRVRAELSLLQQQYAKSSTSLTELEFENSDSLLFISELERRIEALADSEVTRSYFGAVTFKFCPCCLEKVNDSMDGVFCPLCKTGEQKNLASSQLLRMRNELSIQRTESMKLMAGREERVRALREEIPRLRQSLRRLEDEYQIATTDWVPPVQREADELNLKIGALNQRLVQIGEYQKLADVIESLQAKRAELEARKSELTDLILAIQSGDEVNKSLVQKAIFDELILLLRKDIRRQDEFIDATVVDWDFGSNSVSVNGQKQFSESSMVVLKHCFHLAILAASSRVEEMRFPRFLLLDGIEDGGQEIVRSHSLQRLIVQLSESLPSSHQIIFATSQIAPELATNELVVGKFSSGQDKTLSLLLASPTQKINNGV